MVLPNTEIGFWKSRAARRMPNPLLVRLVRRIWAACPDFTFFGDAHFAREAPLAASGVLPRLHTLE